MFDTIVVATTDGSDSVQRAVSVAVDVAARFDAEVHAVYVVDAGEVESSPDTVRDDLRDALDDEGRDALDRVSGAAHDRDDDLDVTIEVREGRPASEIDAYARSVDASSRWAPAAATARTASSSAPSRSASSGPARSRC